MTTPLLVIVNYNQELEAPIFLEKIRSFYPVEHILFVDDGSADKSCQIAAGLGFKIHQHSENLGVGAAVRSGILCAQKWNYDSIVLMSSNGKTRPEDLATVIKPVQTGAADYCTGSRFLPGGSSPGLTPFRRFSIPVFSLFASLLVGRKFSDITCGFRCYKIAFLFSPEVDIQQAWLNRYEMEYYIHYWACKKGLKIAEVPVSIPYTHLVPGRRSKIQPFFGWWSMIRPLIYLRLGMKK